MASVAIAALGRVTVAIAVGTKLRRFSLGLVSILPLLVMSPAAASSKPPSGISISPFEQQITVQPSDVVKSFTLTLTNHTTQLQELNLSVRDFGSLNDTGGLLLEGSNSYSHQYGLTAWLSLEKNTVDLQPGQTETVLASVNNQSSLQPGGHYGAIIASINSLNQPANNNVVINQQLVSLVLVDKQGGDHYALKLTHESNNGNWLRVPTEVNLEFQNPGNVHVIPRGLVQLVSPSGRVLAQGIINDQSAFVLPESFRQLPVTLTPVNQQVPLPGLYRVRVVYRYDGITATATKNFYLQFVDLKLYLTIIVIVGVSIWLWRRQKVIIPPEKPTTKKPAKSKK